MDTQNRFALDDHAGVTLALDAAHRAYEMHIAGHSWPVIAEQVGYASAKVCHMAVTAYLQKAAVEQTPQRRREALELEAARLDALQNVYWERARGGDLKAGHFVLRIIAERIKLRAPTGKNGAAAIDKDRERVLVIGGSEEEYVAQLKAIVARRLVDSDEEKDAIIAQYWDTDAEPDAHGRIYPKSELQAIERELLEERRQQRALDPAPAAEGPPSAAPDPTAPAIDRPKAASNRTRRSPAGHYRPLREQSH
jgi:hypothetical protein